MTGGAPKVEPTPAAPKADDAAAKAAADKAMADAAALQKRRRGRASTILTTPGTAPDTFSRGTLLGGGGATA